MKIQKKIKGYLKARRWLNLKPADVAKSISIESAELLEHFQWSSPSRAEVLENHELLKKIRTELADVMIYCFDMAVILKFDALKAVREKIKHIERKYPAKLMRSAVANRDYWEIKKKYRREGIN
ncbi:hypothetical protein A2572_04830 [Candidatus Collierbacteria bacterium RIFOXYD1_FULL_40_9]|uniref:Nucleotide pyrophosphohydrolase n=1 Tax=Candidatus Collierbacteria bacterium RIFOXYD1_FULL_40_9 TaxID=1817731 RepID=A0A1F5FVG9_9BACT|nr:MAG: hypothetical protein A2572_04830 [Candidatus Collierbacteria bacterium RIFOXYD1_FULL_40_9]